MIGALNVTLCLLIAPALLCPVMLCICWLTPWRGFRLATVRRRGQRYITLHLSTFDRIGHLTRDRAARFHLSFLVTLTRALDRPVHPVFFVSHLLRPAHRRSLQKLMSARYPGRRWRCRKIPLRRSVRRAIQAQALLQEWRVISVPDTAWVVMFRPEAPRSPTHSQKGKNA